MLELSHIGEILISKLFNRSKNVRDLLCKKSFKSPVDLISAPKLRLNKCGRYLFDGAHKIDIAILDRSNKLCYPIEAKLGFDRLSKNEFDKRFLSRCETSHGGSRIKGSMISILERKLPDQFSDSKLTVDYDGDTYLLLNEWGLICRNATIRNWSLAGHPNLSANCNIVAFEEIVSCYGNKNDFNHLISELIRFDYYSDWQCHL